VAGCYGIDTCRQQTAPFVALSPAAPAGDASTVDTVRPLLSLMGKNIRHMGGAGTGQHTKMVNQILIASNMVGVVEGLLYAHK
jgi:3-hydroxyisobutyrate dehydrogenase-like beta-hydroxyacid dehydrogenase